MLFMNEYEVEDAGATFDSTDTPNLATGARILSELVDWANSNSDGWAYWPKPARAARALMERLQEARTTYFKGHEVKDLTDSQLKQALAPIKAFLTRQGVPHDVDLPWAALLPA